MRFTIPLLLIIFCFISLSLFASPKYKIVDLEIPNVRNSSDATSINDKGQICGTYNNENEPRIFFWDPHTGFRDIGINARWGNPIINNNGIIVGNSYLRNDKGANIGNSIFLWDKKNGLSDMGWQSDKYQSLLDFNNLNHILFIHQNEKNESSLYVCFSSLGALFSDARINDDSKIFGSKLTQNGMFLGLFDLKTGNYEDVFFFKGSCTMRGFNNQGVAIGDLETSYQNHYGFIWSKEKGLELFDTFLPICINDVGQIVGYEVDINHRRMKNPFHDPLLLTLLDKGEKININQNLELEFDPSTPWSCISQIFDINNNGQIVGRAFKAGSSHAILLDPIK